MRVARAFVLSSALFAAACQAIIGAEFDDVTAIDCKRAVPPPRPSVTNAGGTSEILAAITSVNVGDSNAADYRTIGFDLDGVCTGLGHRPSCRSSPWTRADPTDGLGGIDNSGGALMHAEEDAFGIGPFKSKNITEHIQEGKAAPLAVVRIRGWNDRSIDDAIDVDWYVPQPLGRPPKNPTEKEPEKDAWPVWEKTFAAGATFVLGAPYPNSRFRAEGAYVNNYVAVARFPSETMLNLNNVAFNMEGLVLAVTLQYNPARIVDGVIAGRLRQSELFGKMPQMTQSFGVAKICKNDVSYPQVKRYFCKFMDSHADGHNDPNADCDAVSLGMTILETKPVLPGPLARAPEYEICTPEVDPVTETCAVPVTP